MWTNLDCEVLWLLRVFAFLNSSDKSGISSQTFQALPAKKFFDLDKNLLSHRGNEITLNLQDPSRLELAIQTLKDRELLLPTAGGGLRLDKLIQHEVLENTDPIAGIDAWLFAVTLLYRATPEQEDGLSLAASWKMFRQWLPHLQGLLAWVQDDGRFRSYINLECSIVLAEVVKIHAWYLFEHGRYQEASTMLETARRLCENLRGKITHSQHIKVSLQSLNYLLADVRSIQASIALERNSPQLAVEGFEEAYRLRKESKAYNEEITARVLIMSEVNLGAMQSIIGKPKKAIDLLHKCTPHVPDGLKGRCLANEALCYLRLGDLDAALRRIEKALEQETDTLERARCYFTMGNILLAKGDTPGASRAFEASLVIREQTVPSHYLIAFTEHKLGEVASKQGLLEESIEHYSKAVEILRDAEPETCSGAFVRSAWALATVYYADNRADKSGQIKAEAWEWIQKEMNFQGIEAGMWLEDLKFWDELHEKGQLENLVVFSHR